MNGIDDYILVSFFLLFLGAVGVGFMSADQRTQDMIIGGGIAVILVGVILLLFMYFMKSRKRKEGKALVSFDDNEASYSDLLKRKEIEAPLVAIEELKTTVERLEKAFTPEYQTKIVERLIKNHSYSQIEAEFLLREMKRFLIMCGIFKSVPMFSKGVDDVWHEMLMFTRDYQDFSENFYGGYLHHQPTEVGMEDQQTLQAKQQTERKRFDVWYSILFGKQEMAYREWGIRLDKSLSRKDIEHICEDLELIPQARYRSLYLSSFPRFREIINQLCDKFYTINAASTDKKNSVKVTLPNSESSRVSESDGGWNLLHTLLVINAAEVAANHEYSNNHHESNTSCSSSSCSSSSCSSSSCSSSSCSSSSCSSSSCSSSSCSSSY